MKVLITDSKYPDLDLEARLFQEAGLDWEARQCSTPEEVIAAGEGVNALLVQYAPVDRRVLDALPDIGIVSRYGVGVDTVDLEAAKERGVWVSNVPDYGVDEVSIHAYAMVLSLIRHLPFYDRAVRSGQWYYQSAGELRRPKTMTFGVVGVGRIGSAIANQARSAFGKVLGCDPFLPHDDWPAGVEPMSLEELAANSDVISLHVPLTNETHHLFDGDMLHRMRSGSYLVNTSRGPVVDPVALLAALEKGHIAGAGLDVLSVEPPSPDEPLLHHPRTLVTPHAAFYSRQAAQELRQKAVQNIISWLRTGRPDYHVVEGHLRMG